MKAFNSFEEAFNSVNKPTHYEIEHGIAVTEKKLLKETEDLKVYVFEKSDKQRGIVIFYKSSTKFNTWLYWYATATQIGAFNDIYTAYKQIEAENYKITGCNNGKDMGKIPNTERPEPC